jgi:sRNA-binding regulator protein Hfq
MKMTMTINMMDKFERFLKKNANQQLQMVYKVRINSLENSNQRSTSASCL